jgi:hypothetical protein
MFVLGGDLGRDWGRDPMSDCGLRLAPMLMTAPGMVCASLSQLGFGTIKRTAEALGQVPSACYGDVTPAPSQ